MYTYYFTLQLQSIYIALVKFSDISKTATQDLKKWSKIRITLSTYKHVRMKYNKKNSVYVYLETAGDVKNKLQLQPTE